MSIALKVTIAIAALAISAGTAFGQCANEEATGSISKDGSIAPLEGEERAGDAEGVAKDGSNIPLGSSEDQAMSSDDVEAQQQGDETSAAASEDDCPDNDAS